MKKFLISLLLLVPFCTGCANVETEIAINDDKSVSVVNTLSYKGNIERDKNMDASLLRTNYPIFLDKNYDVEVNIDEESSEVVATKSVADIEKEDLNLSSLGFSPANPNVKRYISVKKNLFITSYNVDMIYNYKFTASKLREPELGGGEVLTIVPEYYHKYGDIADMEPPVDRDDALQTNLDDSTRKFVEDTYADLKDEKIESEPVEFDAIVKIRVPAFASYNNADLAKGNVYIWNVKKDGLTHIKLQYVQYSGIAIATMFIVGILLLGLFAYRIVRHENQKRMDNIKNIV